MSTFKQIEANRANAQLSTGPNSAKGKAKAAANGLTHGLNSSPESLFAAHPDQEQAFRALAQNIREDCQPETASEEEAFQLYAWSLFQAKRAQRIELLAQDRWLEDPTDPKKFSQMERIMKLGAMLERRASSALNELRKLQRDRLAEHLAQHLLKNEQSKANLSIDRSLPIAKQSAPNNSQSEPNSASDTSIRWRQPVVLP